jgi:hypothetical protein
MKKDLFLLFLSSQYGTFRDLFLFARINIQQRSGNRVIFYSLCFCHNRKNTCFQENGMYTMYFSNYELFKRMAYRICGK